MVGNDEDERSSAVQERLVWKFAIFLVVHDNHHSVVSTGEQTERHAARLVVSHDRLDRSEAQQQLTQRDIARFMAIVSRKPHAASTQLEQVERNYPLGLDRLACCRQLRRLVNARSELQQTVRRNCQVLAICSSSVVAHDSDGLRQHAAVFDRIQCYSECDE